MVEAVQTAKRDYLRGLEKKYQQHWQNERLFEVNPSVQSKLVGLL
jgi:leucyl-tRNA synthetase